MLSEYKYYLFRRLYIPKANSQNTITRLFLLPNSFSTTKSSLTVSDLLYKIFYLLQ